MKEEGYLTDLGGLTCDSHMSVGFAFIYSVHDLVRAAHKPFGTTLKKQRERQREKERQCKPF